MRSAVVDMTNKESESPSPGYITVTLISLLYLLDKMSPRMASKWVGVLKI